jgi:hypothetical protein
MVLGGRGDPASSFRNATSVVVSVCGSWSF